jgi:hypothetical protein
MEKIKTRVRDLAGSLVTGNMIELKAGDCQKRSAFRGAWEQRSTLWPRLPVVPDVIRESVERHAEDEQNTIEVDRTPERTFSSPWGDNDTIPEVGCHPIFATGGKTLALTTQIESITS